jgi:2-polyprenyl-3-methyl-5-hydroxy-6-metoxy-1,4-benzoquinol methylase
MSEYIGDELGIFKHATNWKSYYGRTIAPYLGARVLEVGAGIGANTKLFCTPKNQHWVSLEPDPKLAHEIEAQVQQGVLPKSCKVVAGTLETFPLDPSYDTVLYVDVLEHIENDAAEVRRALEFLKPGGYLVVLGPAHQFLFSPFDASIGHFRRYSKKNLVPIVPARRVSVRYLDSLGMILSMSNRLLLKQRMPTLKQIQFWDKRVVPISILLDPLFGYQLGKSILGIWQK